MGGRGRGAKVARGRGRVMLPGGTLLPAGSPLLPVYAKWEGQSGPSRVYGCDPTTSKNPETDLEPPAVGRGHFGRPRACVGPGPSVKAAHHCLVDGAESRGKSTARLWPLLPWAPPSGAAERGTEVAVRATGRQEGALWHEREAGGRAVLTAMGAAVRGRNAWLPRKDTVSCSELPARFFGEP